MHKKSLFFALALVASVAITAPAGAQPNDTRNGARGGLSQTAHTHSRQFGSPSGAPTLFPTDPLEFPVTEGHFSYSSVPCNRPAPFNDAALVFHPGYPGVRSPAAVRYLIDGTVSEISATGDRGTVEGTITTILCENGQEGDRYFVSFEGRFRVTSENEAVIQGGTFRIVGGTGRFADLTGQGSIKGSFTCLPPVLQRNRAEDCADLGAFSDAVFRLKGHFADPTPPTP